MTKELMKQNEEYLKRALAAKLVWAKRSAKEKHRVGQLALKARKQNEANAKRKATIAKNKAAKASKVVKATEVSPKTPKIVAVPLNVNSDDQVLMAEYMAWKRAQIAQVGAL